MKRRAFTLTELLMVGVIIIIFFAAASIFFKAESENRPTRGRSSDAQNVRQIALAGIMYGSDYDDMMPITVNGELSRMQDIADGHLTVACPSKGTQTTSAPDAAGGERTDGWPELLIPYIKSRALFVSPGRADSYQIWSGPPKAKTDANYDPKGATYRNQNLFPMYGYNYMFCAPLRIPASKRGNANPANYAVSDAHSFVEADDPSGTIFFTGSQYSLRDSGHGFYVVNAPGMWDAFKNNDHGLLAYWMGGAGSGDWVKTDTACEDASVPCKNPQPSTGFVSIAYNSGANTTFLDGHVDYMKLDALASGTDYATANANADGGGVHITDMTHYLWNLTKDLHGLKAP